MFVTSQFNFSNSCSIAQKAFALDACSDRKYLVVDAKNMSIRLTTDKKLSSSVNKICKFYQEHVHLMNAKSLEIFAFSCVESKKAHLAKSIKTDALKRILKEKTAAFKDIKFKSSDLKNQMNCLKNQKQNLCEKRVFLEKMLSNNLDTQMSLTDQMDVLSAEKRELNQQLKKLNTSEKEIIGLKKQVKLRLKKIKNLKKDQIKIENANIRIKNEIRQIKLSLPRLHRQILLLKKSLHSVKEKIVNMESYFRDLLGDNQSDLNAFQICASIKKTLREFFCHDKNTQLNIRNSLFDKLQNINNQSLFDLVHHILSLENVNIDIVKRYEGFDINDIKEELSQDTIDYLHLEIGLVVDKEDLIDKKKLQEMDEFFLQHPEMLADIYTLMEKTSVTSFNKTADVLFIDRSEKEDVEFKTKTIFADRVDSCKTINKIKGFSERSQDGKTLKHDLETHVGEQFISSKEMTLSFLCADINSLDYIKFDRAVKNYLIKVYINNKESALSAYNSMFQKKIEGDMVELAKTKDLFYRRLNDASIKKHIETATDILIQLLQRNKHTNSKQRLKNLVVDQMLRPKVAKVTKSEFEVLLQSEVRIPNKSFEIRSAKEFSRLNALKKAGFTKREQLTLQTHLLDDELTIVKELLDSLFNDLDFKSVIKNLS